MYYISLSNSHTLRIQQSRDTVTANSGLATPVFSVTMLKNYLEVEA